MAKNKTVEAFEKELFETACPTSLIRRLETAAEIASMVTCIASPLLLGLTGSQSGV